MKSVEENYYNKSLLKLLLMNFTSQETKNTLKKLFTLLNNLPFNVLFYDISVLFILSQ